MRLVCGLLAAVILLTGTGAIVSAQEEPVTMSISPGFDGYCSQPGWCPVRVLLSNEGADLSGELRILIPTIDSTRPVATFSYPVVLPAHSRKAFTLLLPVPLEGARFNVQLVAEGQIVTSQRAALRYLDKVQYLYGVVSRDGSALNFLGDVTPASGRITVAHLELEALPSDPLGWEGLDALVLNDVDTSTLTAGQQEALRLWLEHGGHLIVGGGANGPTTAAGVAALLPVTVHGIQALDRLSGLGALLDAPLAAGPYPVVAATLGQGEALAEQGGITLLARRSVGAGTVDFAAWDIGVNPFADEDDQAALWQSIIGASPSPPLPPTLEEPFSIREAVNSIPELQPPSVLHILAFMLGYTLLVGPVNYLVLRWLKRRELAWLTIPLLVVLFTAIAYLVGLQVRGLSVTLHRLAVVYVPRGAESGRVTELVGLFSPGRTRYDVTVTGGARHVPDYYGSPTPRMRIVEEGEVWRVEDLQVDVGGLAPFVAEGYVEVDPPIADLHLEQGSGNTVHLRGTVRNGSLPLTDALLLVGQTEQRLGDLAPGQQVSISLRLSSLPSASGYPYSYPAALPDRIMGPGDYWSNRDTYRRYQLLTALFPYGQTRLTTGVYLIGWSAEAPLEIEVNSQSTRLSQLALYIFDLPVVPMATATRATIPPALAPCQVDSSGGYTTPADPYLYLTFGMPTIVVCTVMPQAMVQRVERLVVTLPNTTSNPSPPPDLSLWNWRSQSWDRLTLQWGSNAIANPAAYVHPQGSVRMRVTAAGGQSTVMEMPAITIQGER